MMIAQKIKLKNIDVIIFIIIPKLINILVELYEHILFENHFCWKLTK